MISVTTCRLEAHYAENKRIIASLLPVEPVSTRYSSLIRESLSRARGTGLWREVAWPGLGHYFYTTAILQSNNRMALLHYPTGTSIRDCYSEVWDHTHTGHKIDGTPVYDKEIFRLMLSLTSYCYLYWRTFCYLYWHTCYLLAIFIRLQNNIRISRQEHP
jgi:hypothetical protein